MRKELNNEMKEREREREWKKGKKRNERNFRPYYIFKSEPLKIQ